jgi:hypothetical protein
MLLVSGAIPFHHGIGATRPEEITELVTAGVHAFLHGYLAARALLRWITVMRRLVRRVPPGRGWTPRRS